MSTNACYQLLIRKSTFCQKVKVHKDQTFTFISNLKKPACAPKRDVLELTILGYLEPFGVTYFLSEPDNNKY